MKYSDDTLIRLAQKFICDLDQVKLLCARGAHDDIIERTKRERGENHTSYIEISTMVHDYDEPFGVSVDMDMKGHTMFDHYCVFTEEQFRVWSDIIKETRIAQSSKNANFFKILDNLTIEIGAYPGSNENGYYITLADFTSLLFIMSHDARVRNYLSDEKSNTLVTVDRNGEGNYLIGDLIDLQLGKCSISLGPDVVDGLEFDKALLAILEIPVLNGSWELTKMYKDYTVSFKCIRMSDEYDFDYGITICIMRGDKKCLITDVPIYVLADLYLAMC